MSQRTVLEAIDGTAAVGEFRTALAIADKLVALDAANPQWKDLRTELEHSVATCCKGRR